MMFVAFAACMIGSYLDKGVLVEEPPVAVTGSALLIGLLLGLAYANLARQTPSLAKGRPPIFLLAFPLLLMGVAHYWMLNAVELWAFAFRQPVQATAVAMVIDKRSSKRSFGYSATVVLGKRSREIPVTIDRSVYLRLGARGHDCLLLQVDTGRGGVRRAILPNAFEPALGVHRWRTCDWNDVG